MRAAGSAAGSPLKGAGDRGRASRILAGTMSLIVALVVATAVAQAGKGGDSFIGVVGSSTGEAADGGVFNGPQDVAVNQTGAGGVPAGTFYVADAGNNRIQRFGPAGAFQLTWGADVITAAGPPPNSNGTNFEICDVTSGTPNAATDCKAGVASAGNAGDNLRNGAMSAPQGVAVDQDTGDVYVTDRANARVNQYGPGGAFIRSWGWDVRLDAPVGTPAFEICQAADRCKVGGTGSNVGQFGSSTASWRLDISKDGSPATGYVVVADPGNNRLRKFAIDGTPDALVPTFGSSAQFGGSGNLGNPRHVAVDSGGTVYASDDSDANIERFDASGGTSLGGLSSLSLRSLYPAAPADLGNLISAGYEIDPLNDRLLAALNPNAPATADTLVFEIASPSSASPTLADAHMQGSGNQVTNGLGLVHTGSADRLYVSASSGAIGHRLLVLDNDGAGPLGASIDPPSDVGANAATFQATISPNGPTGFTPSYHFEYSKNGVTWTAFPASDVNVADAAAPVPVSQVVTGLEANTFYRVRVVAKRAFDGSHTVVSPELTFLTDAAAPTVATLAPNRVTDSSAQLIGRLNPQGTPSEWHFEYLDDESFQQDGWDGATSLPVPVGTATGTSDQLVHVTATGLQQQTTYRYRLVASNGQEVDPVNAPGDVVAEADPRIFDTGATISAPDGRAYEMVTSPNKVNRRGEDGRIPLLGVEGAYPMPALTSPFGAAALVTPGLGGILDPDAGTGFTLDRNWDLYTRGTDRWSSEAVFNLPATGGGDTALQIGGGASADLSAQAWTTSNEVIFFPSGSHQGTRIFGDGGGTVPGSGWYQWLSDPVLAASRDAPDEALIDDHGDSMVRWLPDITSSSPSLLGGGDPTSQQSSGRKPYRSGPPDWAPHEAIAECTGMAASGDATQVPLRDAAGTNAVIRGTGTLTAGSPTIAGVTATVGTFAAGQPIAGAGIPNGTAVAAVGAGTITLSQNASASAADVALTALNPAGSANDVIAAQACEQGTIASRRGAIPGGADVTVTATSGDGRRIFFTAPDPDGPLGSPITSFGGGNGQAACAALTGTDLVAFSNLTERIGPDTECPSQLYVRQYDSDGNPTVRWISRSLVPNQRADTLFRAARFEAASADGRYVFFRTNQPLLASDPNAGGSVTTGTASPNSWDLYRFELSGGLEDDPTGPGAELVRITGGNDGTADPNTNNDVAAGSDLGTATRYVSDDGRRVYFVTRGAMTGVDSTPPAGSAPANTATGTATTTATRNLYLYDDDESGEARWRFVARLPNASGGRVIDGCATRFDRISFNRSRTGAENPDGNCVRGTTSGDAVLFETTARLTDDDSDDDSDVYLFDATADELIRVSAPLSDQDSYVCDRVAGGRCNGDLGLAPDLSINDRLLGASTGLRHSNISENPDGTLKAVYFESRLQLAPEDVNGDHWDTYEWRDGEVSLISPGNTSDHAFYSGNSIDGRDVFFHTSQRIDPREIDASDGDIYDARVGGGFPLTTVPPVCDVLTGGCHGAVGAQPPVSGVGSGGTGGANVAPPGPRARLSVRALSARERLRAGRTGAMTLTVTTSTDGRVSATARSRIGRSDRLVGRVSKRVGAGRAALRLRLNATARRALRSGRTLRLRVTVRMPGARPRTVTVALGRGNR